MIWRCRFVDENGIMAHGWDRSLLRARRSAVGQARLKYMRLPRWWQFRRWQYRVWRGDFAELCAGRIPFPH